MHSEHVHVHIYIYTYEGIWSWHLKVFDSQPNGSHFFILKTEMPTVFQTSGIFHVPSHQKSHGHFPVNLAIFPSFSLIKLGQKTLFLAGREEPRASGAELLRKARDAAAAAKAGRVSQVLLLGTP